MAPTLRVDLQAPGTPVLPRGGVPGQPPTGRGDNHRPGPNSPSPAQAGTRITADTRHQAPPTRPGHNTTQEGNEMGLFSRSESSNAVSDLRAADKALHDNQRAEKAAGITHETDTYRQLNATANEAASKVSRWRGGTR